MGFNIEDAIRLSPIATPTDTVTGTDFLIYIKSDGNWYRKDSSSVETIMGGAGTILGSIAAAAGLIPFGTGVANTVTSDSNFSWDSTNKRLGVIGKIFIQDTVAFPSITTASVAATGVSSGTLETIFSENRSTVGSALLKVRGGVATNQLVLAQDGSGALFSGIASSSTLEGQSSGGLNLSASNASGVIRFMTGASHVAMASFNSTGIDILGDNASAYKLRMTSGIINGINISASGALISATTSVSGTAAYWEVTGNGITIYRNVSPTTTSWNALSLENTPTSASTINIGINTKYVLKSSTTSVTSGNINNRLHTTPSSGSDNSTFGFQTLLAGTLIERFTMQGDRFGINNSTPTADLDIISANTAVIKASNSIVGTTTWLEFVSNTRDANKSGLKFTTVESGTSGSAKLTISSRTSTANIEVNSDGNFCSIWGLADGASPGITVTGGLDLALGGTGVRPITIGANLGNSGRPWGQLWNSSINQAASAAVSYSINLGATRDDGLANKSALIIKPTVDYTTTHYLTIASGLSDVSLFTVGPQGKVGIGLGGASSSPVTPTSTLQINGSLSLSYVAKVANYTLTGLDYTVDCSGTFTVTLPTAVGIVGRIYVIKKSSPSGAITVATTGGQTIDFATSVVISGKNWLIVQSDNSNWIVIG